MKRSHHLFLILAVAFFAAVCLGKGQTPVGVLWIDADMEDIPEPGRRESTLAEHALQVHFTEKGKRALDVPRWLRRAAGSPKRAANVNALDEVPDSSWYTNRHGLHTMTVDQLVRGPNRGSEPDFQGAIVTKAKTEGVTPGLQLTDKHGTSYLIKFEHPEYPELQSAAEVIATKILYAAGYNVPENYIAFITDDDLSIAPNVEISDGNENRNLTRDDLARMLRRAARMRDGRYRVLASKILEGKAKGPFAYIGLRRDDPNDLIPHEHRRELRGMRVIASWINHWDLKEQNTLDMYVEENGKHFLRHYFIDFGSSMGGGQSPKEYFHGRQYVFDSQRIFKELFTLGAHHSPAEKEGIVKSPNAGIFSAEDFDPAGWKPTLPVMPFDNITNADAFWGVRIILSFTEDELRSIVESGKYTDPRDTAYILDTLLERRRIVARHWLNKVDALDDLTVRAAGNIAHLTFRDSMKECRCTDVETTGYRYQIKGNKHTSPGKTTPERHIVLDTSTHSDDHDIAVSIAPVRRQGSPEPVTIVLHRDKRTGRFDIIRIDRG